MVAISLDWVKRSWQGIFQVLYRQQGICNHTHVITCRCTHTQSHIHMHTHTHTYTHTQTHTQTHTDTHTHTHTCIHTRAHTYIDIYTCFTHIHILTPMASYLPRLSWYLVITGYRISSDNSKIARDK